MIYIEESARMTAESGKKNRARWELIGGYFTCARCLKKHNPTEIKFDKPTWNYCPKCGAEMENGK